MLSQDDFLSPEIEACLNDAERGAKLRPQQFQPAAASADGIARGPAPSVQQDHSHGPGGPVKQQAMQHDAAWAPQHTSPAQGQPGGMQMRGHVGAVGNRSSAGSASEQRNAINADNAFRGAKSGNAERPLPPPAGPPPPQLPPQHQHSNGGNAGAKMKPNAERSCNFYNHRATRSVGKGFEDGASAHDVGPAPTQQKYLMNGSMPRIQDYNEYQKLCGQILGPDDTQKVAGKSFIKKNGWRKLAMAFQISFQILDTQITYNDQGNVRMSSFTVRGMLVTFSRSHTCFDIRGHCLKIIQPCGRFADSWGGCDALEKRFSKPNHDIPATAETRAKNRACADLLGLCYSASKPKV